MRYQPGVNDLVEIIESQRPINTATIQLLGIALIMEVRDANWKEWQGQFWPNNKVYWVKLFWPNDSTTSMGYYRLDQFKLVSRRDDRHG